MKVVLAKKLLQMFEVGAVDSLGASSSPSPVVPTSSPSSRWPLLKKVWVGSFSKRSGADVYCAPASEGAARERRPRMIAAKWKGRNLIIRIVEFV